MTFFAIILVLMCWQVKAKLLALRRIYYWYKETFAWTKKLSNVNEMAFEQLENLVF